MLSGASVLANYFTSMRDTFKEIKVYITIKLKLTDYLVNNIIQIGYCIVYIAWFDYEF